MYGSDAIAGVINIIMKKHVDGTTVDFRVGATQHGGGVSERMQISSGFSNDRWDVVVGVELLNQDPLWAYQREGTNSRQDSPADPSDINASPVFTRIDENGNYLDPGQATCNYLAHLDRGSVFHASRDGYASDNNGGPGYLLRQLSATWVTARWRTAARPPISTGRFPYHLTDHASLFLDLQAGYSHQISYNTPLEWENSYKLNGDSSPIPFFNAATNQVEQWQRRYFTIEENGVSTPARSTTSTTPCRSIRREGQLRRIQLGIRGPVRTFTEPAGAKVACARVRQGSGTVSRAIARHRSGQRLPESITLP